MTNDLSCELGNIIDEVKHEKSKIENFSALKESIDSQFISKPFDSIIKFDYDEEENALIKNIYSDISFNIPEKIFEFKKLNSKTYLNDELLNQSLKNKIKLSTNEQYEKQQHLNNTDSLSFIDKNININFESLNSQKNGSLNQNTNKKLGK